MEVKTLKATLKETKKRTCKTKPQGLPNLIRKKNDWKLKRQLKQAQWCECHVQWKKINKIEKR
jgi:hypothetical protein